MAHLPGIHTPLVRRLDSHGLFDDVEVHGVTRVASQYVWGNIIVLVRDGEQSIVAPCTTRRHEPSRLDRLVGGPWAPVEDAWTNERFFEVFGAHARQEADRIDLAPLLHRGLRRVVDADDLDGIADAIGVLEIVARHNGEGSRALERPWVGFGEKALEDLSEIVARGVDVDDDCSTRSWNSASRWSDPGLEDGPDEAIRRALRGDEGGDASGGERRVAALVRRWHKHDSTVGGQLSEAALVTLRVDEDGWSYERRPLWTEDVLGIEMS